MTAGDSVDACRRLDSPAGLLSVYQLGLLTLQRLVLDAIGRSEANGFATSRCFSSWSDRHSLWERIGMHSEGALRSTVRTRFCRGIH